MIQLPTLFVWGFDQILKPSEITMSLKVKNQRALLRSSRVRNKIPSVAVIGYTNAGKTSLIKAITGTAWYPSDRTIISTC